MHWGLALFVWEDSMDASVVTSVSPMPVVRRAASNPPTRASATISSGLGLAEARTGILTLGAAWLPKFGPVS